MLRRTRFPVLALVATLLTLGGCRGADAALESTHPATEDPAVTTRATTVGALRVRRIDRSVNPKLTSFVVELEEPALPVLGLGGSRALLDVIVDGRHVDLGEPECHATLDEVAGEGYAGVRVAIVFRAELPPDAREIAVIGTIPLSVGADPREEVFTCGPDPTGAEFHAADRVWSIHRVIPRGTGRQAWFRSGGLGHGEFRLDFLDTRGRPIPCGLWRGSGVGFGGRSSVSGSVWMSGTDAVSAVRVTSFGRVDEVDARIDVTFRL